jgi:hypothetical protein
MTHTHNVLRLKTAKAIIKRCYEADKSAAMGGNGLSANGSTINACAVKAENGWDVTISSSCFVESTLKSLVDDVYNAISARKAIK